MERTPNKSQHTELTLEKIPPPLLPGFELATFQSRVRRSNQLAIPFKSVKSDKDVANMLGFVSPWPGLERQELDEYGARPFFSQRLERRDLYLSPCFTLFGEANT